MPKALCITGLVTAGLVLLLFATDLLLSFVPGVGWLAPFGGRSLMMDLVFVLGSSALGYMSWITYQEQV
ncbi:hypothetical protein [Lignipirellula cremea]|uniref:Uncharacterized protein n=1 Tax=Lignipirellula cremea TaxID=2528010 RepID=A0A518E2Y6_9BACT|nr:hypothetical protein [Lignipirellula cremea]QDU98456.1 hypothetical protein Pla8534_63240 [Lignipirellula cremea]